MTAFPATSRNATLADLCAAVDSIVHAQRSSNDYESVRIFGASCASLSDGTLPEDMLSAFVKYRQKCTALEGAVAHEIVYDFFRTRCSTDEFIVAIAEQLDGESKNTPAPMNQFIRKLCTGRGDVFFLLDSLAQLSAEAYHLVTDNSRLDYLWRHRDCFTPVMTDPDLRLAKVLLDNWPGTLVSLVETARQLSAA
jgi:hypothetical protein